MQLTLELARLGASSRSILSGRDTLWPCKASRLAAAAVGGLRGRAEAGEGGRRREGEGGGRVERGREALCAHGFARRCSQPCACV